jgi:heptosyltransferase-2
MKVRKILVFGPNWIGDTVMSTPMIKALKHAHLEADIFMAAKSYVASLWETNPCITALWVVEADSMPRRILGYWRLVRKIRRNQFDLVIILPHYFIYALVCFLAGIKCRIGYDVTHRGKLLTHPLEYTMELRKKHMVDNYLDIVKSIGVGGQDKQLYLNTTPDDDRNAEETLRSYAIKPEALLIGMAPGAIYGKAKRWPKEKYAELADSIIEKHQAQVLIFSGPSERALALEIREAMTKDPVIIEPRPNLRHIAALIKKCSIFVSNDSGLMHIAAAVKTPIVAIFGSTSPDWTKPYGEEKHLVLHKPPDCSPCFEQECQYRTYDCLSAITVSDVLRSVDLLLKNSPMNEKSY